MSEAPASGSIDPVAGPSIHHKAAKYVGVAMVGGFLVNLLFSVAGKGTAPEVARVLSIVPGIFFFSAIPAAIIALCGIRKHGRETLLVSGLAGIIIPVFLAMMAVAAFGKVREVSQTKYLQSVAQEFNKASPKMIDEITRLDGATVESGNKLIIRETIISLNAAEVDREAWTKQAVPAFKAAFAKGPLVSLVKNGATVIYRYYGKDQKLIAESVYEPKDFKK